MHGNCSVLHSSVVSELRWILGPFRQHSRFQLRWRSGWSCPERARSADLRRRSAPCFIVKRRSEYFVDPRKGKSGAGEIYVPLPPISETKSETVLDLFPPSSILCLPNVQGKGTIVPLLDSTFAIDRITAAATKSNRRIRFQPPPPSPRSPERGPLRRFQKSKVTLLVVATGVRSC
jgi:hypothetical protein